LFEELFACLVSQAHRGLRRAMDGTTYLIDSTSAKLNQLSAEWARFSAKVCGAKVHVIYDPDANQPIYAAFTTGNVNDITAAHAMPIEAGATYVFDLGYYDYDWWAELHDADCRIVTRLKKNTRLTITRERLLPPGGPILSDRIGHLPARQARHRRNPMQAEVREIRVRIETGKVLRILTNDLTAPAHEIAELYKRRWMIELFFRWIKQTLRIKRFIGTSENAVRTQIAVALIVFLLLRLAFDAQKTVGSLLQFVRLVRANLMQRRDIAMLHQLDQPVPRDDRQFSIDWRPA
jgi:IS4 transposase